MWGRLRPIFRDQDPIRVENPILPGTPDVNLANGAWIELKWCRKRPKNEDKLFVIDHYTQEQRIFAIQRKAAKGRIFLLLKISNEWLLFDGEVAAEKLNKISLNELRKVALKTWKIKLSKEELRNLILN